MKCISVVENQYLFVVSSKVNCYFLFPPSPCQLIHLLRMFPVCLTISASIVNFFYCSYLQFFLQLRGKKENFMCRQLKQGLNFVQPQGLSLNPHPLFRSFKERHLKSYSVSQILFDFLFLSNGSYSQSCAREFSYTFAHKKYCTISCLKRLALQMRSQTRRIQTSIVILQGLGTEFLGGLERPIEN